MDSASTSPAGPPRPPADRSIDAARQAMDCFAELVELDPSERAERLADLADRDAALAAKVALLLARDASTDGERSLIHPQIVERLLATLDGAETRRSAPSALPQLAGRYRLLRVIGEGGMGTVYEAEQVSPRRLVALKALRAGATAGERALRRFALEAEVLARLQHPGIAQVYEAGFEDEGAEGPAWIAMELVRGDPLVAACRARGIGRRDRLRLFVAICDAVSFAHQRGVIHRDLKPPNILLAEPDTDAGTETDRLPGKPKVLDFGVARVVGDDWRAGGLGGGTLTDAGQLVGTLAYMSPEQLSGDPDAVDVRSDVYALGVILYELLAGRRPFEFDEGDLSRSLRAVRDVDPPPLRQFDAGLAGDLEAIVSKALAKDPRRRYQSVADLAADVVSHLHGEPIAARADSLVYVLSRRARRHRWPLAAACAVLAALVAFAIHSSLEAERFAKVARAERAANAEAEGARAALARELSLSRLDQARLLAKDGSLEAAESIVRSEFATHPTRESRWALREVTARHPAAGVFRHHGTARIFAVAFDEEGMLTAGDDQRLIRLGSAGDEEACVELTGRPIAMYLEEEGPDVILVLSDGAIDRFDRRSLEPRGRIALIPRLVRAARRGDRLLVATQDRRILDIDLFDGSIVEGPPLDVAPTGLFALDDVRIAYGGSDGIVRIREFDGGPLRELRGHAGYVHLIVWDETTRRLVTSGEDRTVRFWDIEADRQVDWFDAGNGALGGFTWRPDGSMIHAGWWGIDRWDPENRLRRRLAAMPAGAIAVDFSGDRVLTGHIGEARLWTAQPGGGRGGPRLVGRSGCALSPDGELLAVSDTSGALGLVDAATGEIRRWLLGHASRVRGLAFSRDGRLLASGSDDRELRLHDVATGALLARRTGVESISSASLSFAPDDRTIATLTPSGSVRILALPTLADVTQFRHSALQPISVDWSPDGSTLVSTARDNRVKIWTKDGSLLAEAALEAPVWTAAWSPDGSRIAVGTWGRTIVLYDAETLNALASLRGPAGLVTQLAWDRVEEDLLLASSADGAIRLWDANDGRILFSLEPFGSGDAVGCSLSNDGRRIAGSGAWGEIAIWDVSEWDRWIEEGRR